MGGRGLLSRMAGGGPVDEVESIGAHLRALLNTRRGDSATSPEYGVVDFADMVHDFPGAIPQLARSIRATIMEFEPRLKSVAVRHVPGEDALVLRFEISGQLARGRAGKGLRFTTTVRPGGRIDVG